MNVAEIQIPFSPYEGDKHYIFISYAHKNDDKVFPLISRLNELKYRIWYDKGINPGAEWPEVIAQHIKNALLVILFMSPEAAESDNVKREVTFSQKFSIPIITIFLKETKLPSGLDLQLSLTQNLYYYEYQNIDAFFKQLLSSGPLKSSATPFAVNDTDAIVTVDTSMFDVAMQYIKRGKDAIKDIPYYERGALLSIEPDEISGFSSIEKLLSMYYTGDTKQPLTLAAFGSYGSSRSFGIQQIARHIFDKALTQTLSATASFFSNEKDISQFFFSVRNCALRGGIPLVFIDDFCAGQFRWLKHFLAPVNEGVFKGETGFHPLGRCVLVFATTQYTTFKDFLKNKKDAGFLNAKGDELICSIKGAVNTSGCNPVSNKDKTVLIRRAILLRGFIERSRHNAVSESLLRAMLLIPFYEYDFRSMQEVFSIIVESEFDINRLSDNYQFAVHVDTDAFQNLLLREG